MVARLIAAGALAIVTVSHAGGLELVRAGKPVATIVVAEKAPEPERFAATELQAFIEKATGAKLAIAAKAPGGGQAVVFVGQVALREAGDKLVAAAQLDQLRDDGYAIVVVEQPPALLLVGKEPRATLYAVYDLLESRLGCGFFVDGDHVQRRQDAVVPPVSILASPAFADRACYVSLGLYGPKRFQATLWNVEDWKAYLRWMAKRRMNALAVPFTAESRAWGAAFDRAFPEAKAQRQATLEGGGGQAGATARMGWGLHPEHTTAVLSEALAYARKTLGLEVTYLFAFGEFEEALRKAMPALKWKAPSPPPYLGPAGGNCALSAAEPKCRELQARLWKAIIETYGTDHRYAVFAGPLPRLVAGVRPTENTLPAALEALRAADPAAKPFVSTWDNPLWGDSAEAKTSFLRRLPEDIRLLYWDADLGTVRRMIDLTGVAGPGDGWWSPPSELLYTATEYFAGRAFEYAVHWGGGAGNDLFENRLGMLANCFHNFRHFVPTPRAVGFWNWNDLRRVNPLMDELCSEFAWSGSFVWRGEGASTNRRMYQYLERRYGVGAIFPMAEAYKQALRGAPRVDADVNYRAYVRRSTIPAPGSSPARAAVTLAIACKAAATGSPFYEADLVDLGRNYLHQYIQEQVGQALAYVREAKRAAAGKSYADQAKKDLVARLQKTEARILRAHKALSRLIATRKDMCLDDAILEAVATKGANPLLAQAIREHQSGLFANGYPLIDSIEYHQQLADRQLRYLLDYAKRELNSPTAEAIPGWEVFFRHGASEFVEKAQPAPYDKKAEQAPASTILQEFLEAAD
ncbi:MAG TPA: alpha-glucuronidase family glycosyl hydrolase [Planctomycetota bacterium]|nr:alpha-glucuronidase family glycosyl hydrolase [Planctomycetota bacterium]